MRRHLFADALRLLGAGMALLAVGILLRPLVNDDILRRLAGAVAVLGAGLCIGAIIQPALNFLAIVALCILLNPTLFAIFVTFSVFALAYLLP